MNLKQLEYFVLISRHGSFSRAASALNIGHPALSRHIRDLEEELRRPLFHRNGRGVVLTDAGTRFLSYAQNALQQLSTARAVLDESEDDIQGRVAVGMPPSVARVMTVPLVQAFQHRFGKAQIAISEGLSTTLQEHVMAGLIDIAIMHNPGHPKQLYVEPLLDESLYLLSPPGDESVFMQPETAALHELSGLRLIFPSQPHPIRRQIESEANRHNLQLDIALEIEALASIPLLVHAGCGHAVVPESVLWAELPSKELRIRRMVQPMLKTRLALVSATRRPQTLLISAMQSMVRDLLTRISRTKAVY